MLEKTDTDTLHMRRWTVGWSYARKFGFEFSKVVHHGDPYLSRWIVYLGWGTLRLHKFWRGDDDRAPHTHPWWFITFPLRSYVETVWKEGVSQGEQRVKAFRFHYRPATYEHIVKYAVLPTRCQGGIRRWEPDKRPFYTIVISGERSNGWGFYPEPAKFVPWREFIHTYESKQ